MAGDISGAVSDTVVLCATSLASVNQSQLCDFDLSLAFDFSRTADSQACSEFDIPMSSGDMQGDLNRPTLRRLLYWMASGDHARQAFDRGDFEKCIQHSSEIIAGVAIESSEHYLLRARCEIGTIPVKVPCVSAIFLIESC